MIQYERKYLVYGKKLMDSQLSLLHRIKNKKGRTKNKNRHRSEDTIWVIVCGI